MDASIQIITKIGTDSSLILARRRWCNFIFNKSSKTPTEVGSQLKTWFGLHVFFKAQKYLCVIQPLFFYSRRKKRGKCWISKVEKSIKLFSHSSFAKWAHSTTRHVTALALKQEDDLHAIVAVVKKCASTLTQNIFFSERWARVKLDTDDPQQVILS